MTFTEFKEKFNPLILNESEVGLKQLYVPNTWPESKILLAHPTKCIWTIVKKDGKLFVQNDLHFKNRVANIICANVCNEPRETYKIEVGEVTLDTIVEMFEELEKQKKEQDEINEKES